MNIEIKKSQKPVKYEDALTFMEKRLYEINKNDSNDLIWILEHEEIYTAGTSFKEKEILDKSIKIIKTNRGGKITYHGPGQLICYFVINLKKRKKDIRKFISVIEKTIIDTIKSAKKTLRLSTYALSNAESGIGKQVVDELVNASQEGVEITILQQDEDRDQAVVSLTETREMVVEEEEALELEEGEEGEEGEVEATEGTEEDSDTPTEDKESDSSEEEQKE